jgi:hypothetical protein
MVAAPMSEELPKQELLLKLLKMTTSSNDAECLVAIRKANAVLKGANWDWDKLIAGKIKVIADPFSSISTPPSSGGMNINVPRRPAATAPYQPPQSRYKPKPQYTPPPPPKNTIDSTMANKFGSTCYCCNITVPATVGFIFKPQDRNPSAESGWKVICKTCNSKPNITIPDSKAKRFNRVRNINDLA